MIFRDARNPNESTERFLEEFAKEVKEIEEEKEEIEGGDVRGMCERLIVRLNGVDGRVSQAAYYLPPYDVRQCRIATAALRKKVQEL